MRHRSRPVAALGLATSLCLQWGCSASAAKSARAAEGGIVQHETEIVHEECDVAEASTTYDANGDGRPDVSIVTKGGGELCRALDLNFDGTIDSYVYYDANGQVRRREADYDRDGRIDEIITLQGGVVVEKQRATMLTGKLDTWEYYERGVLARSERDSDGDSNVDQWWEYPKPGCPVIHADVNNDGRPDPGVSIDYCKETGYVPPERQDFKRPESPDFQAPGALPTELESKEAPAKPAPETKEGNP